jgi:hypothetical protein
MRTVCVSFDDVNRLFKKISKRESISKENKTKRRQLWGYKNVDEIFMSGILFFVNKKKNKYLSA